MTKITGLPDELTEPDKYADWLVVVDTSDLTMSPEGTNKRLSIGNCIDGLLNDRGFYSFATGSPPSSGGSGPGGAIRRGDIWTINVGGQYGDDGDLIHVNDVFRALVDNPGSNPANWHISHHEDLDSLPTTDPGVAGQLWVNPANQFALTVSQG